MNRRSFLGGAAVLGLAGCSASSSPPSSASSAPSAPTTAATAGRPPVTRPLPAVAALEERYGVRIGVKASVVQGDSVGHRVDQRFPMCSTFKVLAVAAVLREFADLGRRVRYSRADLLEYAPVTSRHVATGMTLAQLCDAAIRYSDNTAANLLLEQTGGPSSVTRLARSLGDRVTRLDRTEPALNTAVPGDPRDTTTPAAYAATLTALLLGAGLDPEQADRLRGWMTRNTTGEAKIRAGVPTGWEVADKTGSGAHGTSNDVALVRAPGRQIALTVFTTGPAARGTPEPTLVAQVTRAALKGLAAG